METVKIWAIDSSSGETAPVESTNQTDTEKLLEDTLVKHPEMLMPGLTLVGRQTPVAGGNLDLLGVDADGRLVVLELKRGTLTRDAVTQVVDYGSYLESLETTELATHIAGQSGALGIDKIEDFEEWYAQRSGVQNLQDMKPVRMMLVGLGADAKADRMVSFLAKRDVDIALLTFHGYKHAGKTLLARQVQVELAVEPPPVIKGSRGGKEEERRKAVHEHALEKGISYWKETIESFTQLGSYAVRPIVNGFTFYLPSLALPEYDWKFFGSHSVKFEEDGKVRVTFFPIAVHLCHDQYTDAGQTVPFKQETPPNAPSTNEVDKQWYCVLDEEGWRTHKEALIALASDVYAAWDEARRNVNKG